MAEYGTKSKNILKNARTLLEGAGLIVSEHGRGVFVRKFRRYLRHGSRRHLSSQRPAGTTPTQAETESQGIDRDLQLVDVETVLAPADIAERLGVPVETPLIRRRNIITLDATPAETAASYFRPEDVEGSWIARPEKRPEGVHAELARALGEPLTRGVEEFVARMPTPAEWETLALLPGTPVVELLRTFYAGDRPVEVTRWTFDAARHWFVYDVPVD